MERRKFISRTGLALAGGLVASSCGSSEETPSEGSVPSSPGQENASLDSWEGVRNQFNLSPDKIHLSALLVSTHPHPVREAIEQYRRRLNEDPVTYLNEENNERKEAVRRAAGSYLGVDADDIALTDSTTMGIAMVYHGLQLRPGQEILATEHGYYSTDESLRFASARSGASIRRARLYDDPAAASEEQIVESITQALTPATRVLALTWVHSSTGVKLPLPQITEAVAEANAGRAEEDRVLVCVDGVHGLGVEDITMDELGCDFFMAGCHKWLFGPRGTGIVWGRSEAWAQTLPVIPSFFSDANWAAWAQDREPPSPTTAAQMSPGGFKPFEHQWAMREAFEFHEEIGKARVEERTHKLNRQLKEGLNEMPHVTLRTPLEESLSAGIVCFDIDGMAPGDVVNYLEERNVVASVTPYATPHARLTPSIYNAPEEVEAALDALRTLA